MADENLNQPATVPEQPEAKPPVRKGMPLVIALVVIIALIGIANLSSLVSGNKKAASQSALPMRPARQTRSRSSSFETQQQAQARQDADLAQRQQQLAAAMQQLQAAQETPGPEAAGAPPMTAAQRDAIYGNSANAPSHTSNVSEAQAEAKQKQLAREKQQQDAINSDTVAIDFQRSGSAAVAAPTTTAVLGERQEATPKATGETITTLLLMRLPRSRPLRRRAQSNKRNRAQRPIRWGRMTSTPTMGACIGSLRAQCWRRSSPTTSTADSAARSCWT